MPLILYPNAQLHLHETGEPLQYEDVAYCAHQYLHEPVKLSEDLRLSDILCLLIADPVLKSVYKLQNAVEIATAVRNHMTAPQTQLSASAAGLMGADDTSFDYLELAAEWLYNSHNNRYYGTHMLSLMGVAEATPELLNALGNEGFTDLVDPYDNMVKQQIGLVPLEMVINLPIRISQRLPICEGDPASRQYLMVLREANMNTATLGEVLYSVLAELAAHGSFQDIENMRDAIHEKLVTHDGNEGVLGREAAEAIAPPGAYYDLEMFGALSSVLEAFHGISPVAIKAFLSDLDDESIAADLLLLEFGDAVKVREAYKGLNAREFRRKLLQGVKD